MLALDMRLDVVEGGTSPLTAATTLQVVEEIQAAPVTNVAKQATLAATA
jgi:hypothetical protein